MFSEHYGVFCDSFLRGFICCSPILLTDLLNIEKKKTKQNKAVEFYFIIFFSGIAQDLDIFVGVFPVVKLIFAVGVLLLLMYTCQQKIAKRDLHGKK